MASLTVKLPAALNRRLRSTAHKRKEKLSVLTRRALERELASPARDIATFATPLDMFRGAPDLSVTKAWDEEIRARVKAVDEGRVTGIPYEQIKKEMVSRFGR